MQVGELTLAVSRLNNEKVQLEQSMEMEEEGIVNRLQRVIETVMARNKVSVHTCALSPLFLSRHIDRVRQVAHLLPQYLLSLDAAVSVRPMMCAW